MAKTPEQIKGTYYRNSERKTGTTTPGRLTRHSEMVAWLKTEHGLGHGYGALHADDV